MTSPVVKGTSPPFQKSGKTKITKNENEWGVLYLHYINDIHIGLDWVTCFGLSISN